MWSWNSSTIPNTENHTWYMYQHYLHGQEQSSFHVMFWINNNEWREQKKYHTWIQTNQEWVYFTYKYKTNKSTKISELVQRYFDTNCHPTNKKITKKTIPVSSKAPSCDPILHRNPLSSLPPEATSDASVGLHATVKTSSVPRKMEGTIKGVLAWLSKKGVHFSCVTTCLCGLEMCM